MRIILFTQSSKFMIKHFGEYAQWVKKDFLITQKKLLRSVRTMELFEKLFKDDLEIYGSNLQKCFRYCKKNGLTQ